MSRLKYKFMCVLTISTFLFLTGCSSEREEKRLSYRQEGITYMEEGKYEKALESFRLALDEALGEIDETTLDICFYKAKTQYLSGDTEGALATYDAIIAYNDSPKAYFLRGNLYYTLGEEGKAFSDYKKAAEEKADYELYIGIYENLTKMGKEREGQEYLDAALEIKGDKADDKLYKGRIHLLLEEYETAASLLKEAAESEIEANFYLFEVYNATDDFTNAQKYLNTYLESKEVDAYKLYEIGKNQAADGNYELSVTCLEQALALEEIPNKQQVMKLLVSVHESNGNFSAAKACMAEYVAAYPEDEEAKREYTFLETR
uniref:tetratricopeptide repeat protein n=1 Tax=Agathobacter sp. TaxID=2021311 RepID=UPI004056662A